MMDVSIVCQLQRDLWRYTACTMRSLPRHCTSRRREGMVCLAYRIQLKAYMVRCSPYRGLHINFVTKYCKWVHGTVPNKDSSNSTMCLERLCFWSESCDDFI
jgi:hypothetical protein